MPVTTLSSYKNWKPVFNKVIRDNSLANTIYEKGYSVIPFLNPEQLLEIKDLYAREHSINTKDGAMFYGLYSKDLAYRKRVHDAIGTIVNPLLDQHFTAYKNVVNTFVTKVSGPKSEFYVHQDTTALDEFKYSPLSVWIPLQDITLNNGALGVIEKTHWFFSPYRSISFSFPFSKINDVLKRYLTLVYLKAGEALVFDPRIVHNSLPNLSGTDRLVALCGVFPQEAEFVTCFKEKTPGSAIELIKHNDNYLLENTNFYYDCHVRPQNAEVTGSETEDFPEMDAAKFEELCSMNGISKSDIPDDVAMTNCNFIAEPDGINRNEIQITTEPQKKTSVWKRIKTVFN